MTRFLSEILDGNVWLLLVLFCLVSWLFSFADSEFLMSDELYDRYLEERRQDRYDGYDELAAEYEDDLEEYEEEYEPLSDMLIDVALRGAFNLVRFTIVACFLFTAVNVFATFELSFGSAFKIAVIAQSVYFIGATTKLVWLYFFDSGYSYLDMREFNPYGILYYMEQSSLNPALKLIFSKLNLLEFLYVIVLLCGVKIAGQQSIKGVLRPVLGAYLTMLLISIGLRLYFLNIF